MYWICCAVAKCVSNTKRGAMVSVGGVGEAEGMKVEGKGARCTAAGGASTVLAIAA